MMELQNYGHNFEEHFTRSFSNIYWNRSRTLFPNKDKVNSVVTSCFWECASWIWM